MFESLLLIVTLLAAAAVLLVVRDMRARRLARQRLSAPSGVQAPPADAETSSLARRHAALPWLAGAALAGGLHWWAGLALPMAAAIGLILALVGQQLDAWRVRRHLARVEGQLAAAIDLMVAALGAGAGVSGALEIAARESRQPLRGHLEEMLGRIRLGDDPLTVLHGLERRVPLETFRLFSNALCVHWEVGGSLAPTLATVGRVVRDRIEIARRIHTLATQGRASTVAILLITYFIGLVMWRSDPARMAEFAGSALGEAMLSAALALQGIGLAWTAALTRLRY